MGPTGDNLQETIKIGAVDGPEFKKMVAAATAWLEQNSPTINALNVFPVPDGDTGTNMLLTMQSAVQEINSSPDQSLSGVAQAVAHGSLMGARGNSGVILSQILRGVAKSLASAQSMGPGEFAAALDEGSRTAYKGVIQPVEGTILTVVREAASAAQEAAGEGRDLVGVLEKTVEASRHSVARTPLLLDVLREAGVVDAGGQGLHVILDAFLRYLKGEEMEMAEIPEAVPAAHLTGPSDGKMEWGYCTEFMIQGEGLDYPEIRDHISAMGNSALIVGDESLIRVHVHTFDPGEILTYATALGTLHKVKIDNMQDQHHKYLVIGQEAGKAPTPAPPCGVVVVAAGEGFRKVFESLGAQSIVPGGQTMNPSTQELLQAVESAPSPEIILLPNNKNILLAAQEAVKMSKKKVALVPTTSIPQGIAALIALQNEKDLEANRQTMEKAVQEVETIEVTRAVRATALDGKKIKEGEIIALRNDKLAAVGKDIPPVIKETLHPLADQDFEIVTLYYGSGVEKEDAEALANKLRGWYPRWQVECIPGGQPHYPYIIAVE
ncbi:MAG: DAK2 domain-containing protein [Chloroflexi bacterium]|nr:DAK2 domain-containing protein [Chloroflexota bacterium]